MKKQLLLIAFFLLGLSYVTLAQLNPRPVNCLEADALHPIPGTPYEYEITIPDPVGGAWTELHYNWFVTQDPDYFIQAGQLTTDIEPGDGTSPLFNWESGSAYNVLYNGSGTLDAITLTWKAFAYDPDVPVFVGILVTGGDGSCSPNNLKVFRIEPLHAFTLDIDNLEVNADYTGLVNHTPGDSITGANYGDNLDVCISDIVGAVFDPTNPLNSDGSIDYDYGQDTLFFEVVAANWYEAWELSVQIDGLITDSAQIATIAWAYDVRSSSNGYNFWNSWTWNSFPADFTANTTPQSNATLIVPQNSTGAVNSGGESIILRVIVDHGTQWDGVYDNPITIGVNGVMATNNVVGDPDIVGDIHHTEGPAPDNDCPFFDNDYEYDLSLQTIKARPVVNSPLQYLPQGQ